MYSLIYLNPPYVWSCISHPDISITKLNHYQDTKLNLCPSRRYFNISSLFCSYRSLLYTLSFLASVPMFVVPSTINEESIIASNLADRVLKVIYFIFFFALLLFHQVLELLIHSNECIFANIRFVKSVEII